MYLHGQSKNPAICGYQHFAPNKNMPNYKTKTRQTIK
jgi:hypothetical protein